MCVSTSSVHLSGQAGHGDSCLSLRQGLQVLADEVAALTQLQGPHASWTGRLPYRPVCSSRDCRECLVHSVTEQQHRVKWCGEVLTLKANVL